MTNQSWEVGGDTSFGQHGRDARCGLARDKLPGEDFDDKADSGRSSVRRGIGCALAVSAGLVRAQSGLPTGWSSRDIGSTGVVGSAAVSSGTWTITGSGANIWGTSDEFHFAYQQITGDVDVRVRLASLEAFQEVVEGRGHDPGNAGANSRNAFMMVRLTKRGFLQSRRSRVARRTGKLFLGPRLSGCGWSAGQRIHRLFFLERDVMDDGGYCDHRHDCRRYSGWL